MDQREPDRDETPAEQREDSIPDLDVADGDGVVGGSLNAYSSKLQGEKQSGSPK